jgi:hypothetical protein
VVLGGPAGGQRRLARSQHPRGGDPPGAILLPADKPPAWLRGAAATAERQVLADSGPDVEQPTDGDTRA